MEKKIIVESQSLNGIHLIGSRKSLKKIYVIRTKAYKLSIYNVYWKDKIALYIIIFGKVLHLKLILNVNFIFNFTLKNQALLL